MKGDGMKAKEKEWNIRLNVALLIVVIFSMTNAIVTTMNMDTMAFNYICYGAILVVLLYNTVRSILANDDRIINNTVQMYVLTVMTVMLHITSYMAIRVTITVLIAVAFILIPVIQVIGNLYYLVYLLKKHADRMAVHMMLICDSYIMLKTSEDSITSDIFNKQMDDACASAYADAKKMLVDKYFHQLRGAMLLCSFDDEDIMDSLSSLEEICDVIYHNTLEVYEERRKERDEN